MELKLLNDVISEIIGKPAIEIVDLLVGKKDVNEFFIAKKLKLTINQVRNILYKLSNFNLVTFTRKKDKRKGWYTYFWTLDSEKSMELLANQLKKNIDNSQQQLKSKELKRFYVCNTCKTEVSEETALLHNFICQECGDVYSLADNTKAINELKKVIIRLVLQRDDVLRELNNLKAEREKKTKRRERKEAKKEEKKKKRKLGKRRKKSIKKIKKLVKKAVKKKKRK